MPAESYVLQYSVTEAELAEIKKWIKKHDKKHKKDKVVDCAGMVSKYYIRFIDTNLGTYGECVCSKCEESNKEIYDKLVLENKRKKAQKYEYSFCFRDLM